MTSESKVLTVSYGAFSCTLEGFDNPFETLKVITEYFQGLAGNDRYFGAEPPQPDAAMLHRSAEQKVARMVERRMAERLPTDHPDQTGSNADATGASVSPEGIAAAPEPHLHDEMPKGFSARLARIRAATGVAPHPDAPTGAPVDDPRPEPATTATEEEMASDQAVLDRLDALIKLPELPAPDVAAEDAAAPLPGQAAEPLTDLTPKAPKAEAAASPPEVMDSAARPGSGTLDDLVKSVLPEAEDPAESPAAARAAEPQPDSATVFADVLAEDAFIEGEDTMLIDAGAFPGPENASAPNPDDEEVARSEAMAVPEDPAAAPAGPSAEGQNSTGKPGSRYQRVSSRVVRLRNEDSGQQEAPPGPGAAAGSDSGPVKRKRGADAEMSRLLRQAESVMADEDNRRRLDAIALMKAAVVVAETDRAASDHGAAAGEDKRDPYRDDLAQAVEPMPAAGTGRPQAKRRKTRSVRLPETRSGATRPAVYSPPPLVLVTEQRVDRAPPPLTLSQPMAPVGGGPADPQATAHEPLPKIALRTGRLTGAIGIGSAAALRLAAEPRLHLDQADPVGEAETDDELDEALPPEIETRLVRFAGSLALTSTVELLEAAAAFATCVEQRQEFTRPQLMRRLLASAASGGIGREDGLRSFGTLLRTGRIEKVGRGHYMLSQNSPYLAKARRFS